MKILVAASEAFPFCKTGGLGDVVGALAQVFSRAIPITSSCSMKHRLMQ